MTNELEEINTINFGIYSVNEILSMSVCKIDSVKKNITYGTVYDPRMGTTNFADNCETCDKNSNHCIGHFGHIELVEHIVHPLYYKYVLYLLRCFCFKCYKLLLTT